MHLARTTQRRAAAPLDARCPPARLPGRAPGAQPHAARYPLGAEAFRFPDAQINGLRAEGTGIASQLRDTEMRLEAALRENVGLKGELDRLAHQARPTRAAGCAHAARRVDIISAAALFALC